MYTDGTYYEGQHLHDEMKGKGPFSFFLTLVSIEVKVKCASPVATSLSESGITAE